MATPIAYKWQALFDSAAIHGTQFVGWAYAQGFVMLSLVRTEAVFDGLSSNIDPGYRWRPVVRDVGGFHGWVYTTAELASRVNSVAALRPMSFYTLE